MREVKRIKRIKNNIFIEIKDALQTQYMEYKIGNYIIIIKPFSITIKKK